MRIIAVDDEPHALRSMARVVKSAMPDCMLDCFDDAEDTLAYAKENQVDVALLDIEIGGVNGLQLAKTLKDTYGKTNIIFVTGFSEYALDAHALHPSGYIMKPITEDSFRAAMENLRHPVSPLRRNRVWVQTFGNFEVFADGKPLAFARKKTKELFAYLVSREGAMCGTGEIIAALWEDDPPSAQDYFRQLSSDLVKTLKEAGVSDILVKQYGAMAVAPNRIDCDLYEFQNGKGVNAYKGEFMAQYSWAEFFNGYLNRSKS